jgi:ribosomal-protein-alanine N-acetyltransferase
MELYESYPETFIVAEENGGIVGYIMCRIESGVPGLNFLGKKGHVVSIAVLPQHQRKGIGSALLQEAMRNMKHYKAKECYLEVRISNEAAISLYKKLGFRITRTLHGYYADGEAAYIMTKKLAQSSS